MGLFNLFRVCTSLLFISAINLAHANYIYNSATGVWMPTASTVLAPPNSGSTFIPASGIPPNPTVNNGAFTTTSGGSFGSSPVNGTSKRVPITINGTATKVAVNNAVASRLLKGNLAGLALGYGIQELLNGVGWIINEGGQVTQLNKNQAGTYTTTYDGPYDYYTAPIPGSGRAGNYNCPTERDGTPVSLAYCNIASNGYPTYSLCYFTNGDLQLVGSTRYTCYYSASGLPVEPFKGNFWTEEPLTDAQVRDGVNNSYNPHPSDYPTIVSEPSMMPTESTVEPIPRLNFPSVQTTYTDLDTGETIVTETNIWHDYAIHNNGSSQPKIEEQQTEQKDTFKDGVKTSTSTTTSSSGVATGGASAPAPTLELPPFCGWAGIVCDWIGWTQEPIEDDLDLAALINDEDYERNYSISFGDNSCPAPISINVVFLNQTVELSYEPACQLAVYAKPFVLISAYIFAIFITLGVVRNG